VFLADTNVLSELRKAAAGRANPGVVAWVEKTEAESVFVSPITLMELEIGILRVERKDPAQARVLRRWMADQVAPAFENRVLAFDGAVGIRCAALHVPDRRPDRDAMIAATALVHGLTVVTRNTRDFEPMGVPLLNPWEPAV
jgi:toxin FitB